MLARHPDRYHVVALSAQTNFARLAEQCNQHQSRFAVISDDLYGNALQAALNDLGCQSEVLTGRQALSDIACLDETNVVMAAIVGAAGLEPTLHAVQAGKRLLLANKESMVIAGELFRQAAAEHDATIIPVDSEHNALFQVLPENFNAGLESVGVERLILTASGGPFLGRERDSLCNITPDEACNHPNWDMGAKISVDSATMMNKGLEYIEAKWLFGVDTKVEIIVHAQSIIHSMIEFVDTSIIAQLGIPDMRVPIAYALTYPDRFESELPSLDLASMGNLTFEAPDFERFPCLKLAMDAMEMGQTMPAVLNAANEIAVQAFLDELIPYKDIAEIIRMVMQNHSPVSLHELQNVLDADHWAREEATKLITVTHH